MKSTPLAEVTPKLCILPKQSSITCHELPDQKEAQSFTSLVRMATALLPMLTSLTSQAISTTTDFFRAFNTQERVLITVKGNLRDRLFKQTLKETTKMLARLSSRLWVLNCLVRVRSDMDETFIFNNPKWVYKREITDWARNLLWKFDDGKDQ